jgi:hypothetical protein
MVAASDWGHFLMVAASSVQPASSMQLFYEAQLIAYKDKRVSWPWQGASQAF